MNCEHSEILFVINDQIYIKNAGSFNYKMFKDQIINPDLKQINPGIFHFEQMEKLEPFNFVGVKINEFRIFLYNPCLGWVKGNKTSPSIKGLIIRFGIKL